MTVTSRERPTLRPDLNSSRYWLDRWVAESAATLRGADVRVLDAGAGAAPYRKHFTHVQYETADFGAVDKAYGAIDYVCDLSAIPVADATYDVILSTQVLEHMVDPLRTLREFYRLLKPGAVAWLSAPLFFPEHEAPYDYFRYTRYGWHSLAERADFEVVSVEWLEGYDGTLSYQLGMAARSCARWNLVGRAAYLALAYRYSRRDRRRRRTDVGMPKNYRVVLRKPR